MITHICTNLYKEYFNLRKKEDKNLYFLKIYKEFKHNTCIIPNILINDLIIDKIYDNHEHEINITYKSILKFSRNKFKDYINDLLMKNSYGSIIIYPVINNTDISYFCSAHVNSRFRYNMNEAVHMFYDNNFNICVIINTNAKAQYSLSTELYYKFNKLINIKNNNINVNPIIIGEDNRQWINNIMPNKKTKRDMLYIKNGIIFNIWIEYIKDQLQYYNYTLEDILVIVKDKNSFKKELNRCKNIYWNRDILLFTELLYLSNSEFLSELYKSEI